MGTIIHSNGSKWAGQEPDTIDQLIYVLKSHTIEERFFHSFSRPTNKGLKWYQLCPVNEMDYGDATMFFGNFETISHVFRIESNDPVVIEKLTKAIKNNKGWELYRNKNLAPTS